MTGKQRYRAHDNPFGLTVSQAQAMDAVVETGCYKLAAEKLGLSTKTIEAHIGDSRAKLGGRFRLHSLLAWDRWRQKQKAGVAG